MHPHARRNHAARLETTSHPGCIHVSETTHSLISKELPGLGWVATGGVMLKVWCSLSLFAGGKQ